MPRVLTKPGGECMSSGKLRSSEARATTVVLVHDGFLDPFGSDVTTELEDRGIATMVVNLPRMGDPDEGRLGDLYADARKRRATPRVTPAATRADLHEVALRVFPQRASRHPGNRPAV